MRDAGCEGACGREPFGLEQRIEHLAALGDVAQDHLDDVLFAEGDHRGVYVEKKRPDWKFRSLGRALADHRLETVDDAVLQLRWNKIGERMSNDIFVVRILRILLGFHLMEPLG